MPVINVFQTGAQLAAPVDNTSRVRPDNSGMIALAREGERLAGTIGLGIQKQQEQIAVADVMQANNEYNLKMGELRAKLMENKESNAFRNMELYDEGRRKIIGNIISKGPQTLRYGTGQKAFMNMTDKDWVMQSEAMRKYVAGERERFQDTQYTNQLNDGMQNIIDGYIDDDTVEGLMHRGEYMAMARFFNHGAERVKMEQNKVRASYAATAITAAVNADNYERAGELLQGYGKYLTPKERLGYDKTVNEIRRNNEQIIEFDRLYKEYGQDIAKAFDALEGTGMASVLKGKEYLSKIMGQNFGVNQCANTVSNYLKAAGADSVLYSSLADGMYANFEEKGLTFTDRKQLRDGDIVYWQVDGSGFAVSDDKAAVQSDSKAYKGITHVGVYNAKTGKVIQSGSHGVSEMDLDTAGYHPVGFSHIRGAENTPVQQMKKRREYMNYVGIKERERVMADNQRYKEFQGRVFGWLNSGISFEDALSNARQEAGTDMERLQSNVNAVKIIYGLNGKGTKSRSRGTSSSSGETSEDKMLPWTDAAWIQDLQSGKIQTREDAVTALTLYDIKPSQLNSGLKLYDEWFNNKGVFSYDLKGMKQEVFQESQSWAGVPSLKNLKNNDSIWNNAVAAVPGKIVEYEKKNGRAPSQAEVKTMLITSMIERPYSADGQDFIFTDGQLARSGIKNVIPSGAGFDVYFLDPARSVVHISPQALQDMIDGRY